MGPTNFFIGLNLSEQFLIQSEEWAKLLGVRFSESEDPEELFHEYISWSETSLRLSNFPDHFGILSHFGGNHALLEQDWFQQAFIAGIERKKDQHRPLATLQHIPYRDDDLPLNSQFLKTLTKDVHLALKLGSKSIVLHAPRTVQDTTKEFILELTSPEILEILQDNKINLAIENAQDSGTFFQSMEHLLNLRKQLGLRFQELGKPGLINRIQFCFDTGHYLLYQQRDGYDEDEWNRFGKDFLKHTGVIHIHTNDGTKDQHLLPYASTEAVHPTKLPVEYKYVFENSHRVMKWIQATMEETQVPDLFLVMEIDPYFTKEEYHLFLNKLVSKID